MAAEASDNGLLAPELVAGILRVKGVKSKGVRVGHWLSLPQAQALLSAPDITMAKGLRDRAILAVLLGCGLRRSEAAALTFAHLRQLDGRWCIVDLLGKHGRIRTVPMLPQYAQAAGVPGIAPHDARRTCAKLCRAAGGQLEQIQLLLDRKSTRQTQLLLGHASVQTTAPYLVTKQDLVHAPNDGIKLGLAFEETVAP